MRIPKHFSILRANEGEAKALAHLDARTKERLLPLFEVGAITESISGRKYMRESGVPTATHINRTIDRLAEAWGNAAAVVDLYHWAANARTEAGTHVLVQAVQRARLNGVEVIPAVGYDRWEDSEYQASLRAIAGDVKGRYCLRVDPIGIEDSYEPEQFLAVVDDIVETLHIDPKQCFVLLDFADVSASGASVAHMIDRTQAIVGLLSEYGFGFTVIAGCSLPSTINLAVEDNDAEGIVVRKEALAWRALREQLGSQLISGDYGVRGPNTTEIRSKYTNGKIRYTIDREMFVVRGHAFRNDGNFSQLAVLAETLCNSVYYLGPGFSWGDASIDECRLGGRTGSLSHWIAVDTNHHLTFVVQEVEEFVRGIAAEEEEEV